MKYAAVIAAAGLSSRMREFKPLLCIGERTMIETVVQNFKDADVGEIAVVTGYRADALRRHLEPLGVTVCENPDYARTEMFDSLKLGLLSLKGQYDAVFFTPGDVPLVQPNTIRQMQQKNAPIIRPAYRGSPGHPVLLQAQLIPRLLDYPGQRGLLGAMEALGEPILDLPVEDAGTVLDADTPEEFKALRRCSMERRSGGQLRPGLCARIVNGGAGLTPEFPRFLKPAQQPGSI